MALYRVHQVAAATRQMNRGRAAAVIVLFSALVVATLAVSASQIGRDRIQVIYEEREERDGLACITIPATGDESRVVARDAAWKRERFFEGHVRQVYSVNSTEKRCNPLGRLVPSSVVIRTTALLLEFPAAS